MSPIRNQALAKKKKTPDEKREELREELWPASGDSIWDIGKRKIVGFARMPRVMPLITHLIKILSTDGDPSPVYYELWCRDYGQGIIEIDDEQECAYAAGYSSSRALRTWRNHIMNLADLGFIKYRGKGIRDFGYILLVNPLRVCATLNADGKVPDEWWSAFIGRLSDIGAKCPRPFSKVKTTKKPLSKPRQGD